MAQSVWAAVDVGKRHHHCVAMTSEGKKLLSKRVANDEAELRELIGTVAAFAPGDQLTWVLDQNRGGAALLIALLLHLRHRVIYLPPRSFHHAAAAQAGENKPDSRDAHIIADHARTRTDLQPLQDPDDIPTRLRLMTRRRTQPVDDRRKAVIRLRGELLEVDRVDWRVRTGGSGGHGRAEPHRNRAGGRTAIAAVFGLRVRDLDIGLFPPGVGAGRGFFSITFAPHTPVGEYLAVVMCDALGWHYRCRRRA